MVEVPSKCGSGEIERKAEPKKKAVPHVFHIGKNVLLQSGDRVVRDKLTGKTKGYGFVSFSNPLDQAAVLEEMNGKAVGNHPIILRKSL